MISRKRADGAQVIIGMTRAEFEQLIAEQDECIHVQLDTGMSIVIFAVEGDDKALEQEFLRIVAINVTPEKGAKPQ